MGYQLAATYQSRNPNRVPTRQQTSVSTRRLEVMLGVEGVDEALQVGFFGLKVGEVF